MARWYPRSDAPPRSPSRRGRPRHVSHLEAPPVRRGIVILFALTLAGVAAWLWTSGGATQRVHGDGRESHGEIDSGDRETLREVLRDEGAP